MNPFIELTRPSVCALAFFGMVLGFLLLDIHYALWGFPLVSALLICAAGNVINDYFDAEIDKVNRPKRPVPSGRIKKSQVLQYFVLLSGVGLICAYFVSQNFFLFALFNLCVVYLYSRIFKVTPFGNILDTYLAVAVFVAPVFVLGGFWELLDSPNLIIAVIPFFANYSREVLKDVEDMKGDKKLGARTLPIVFGKSRAMVSAKLLLFISAILLFLPYFAGIFVWQYLVFAVLAAIFCVYIGLLNDAIKMQRLIKKLMFFVLAVFLVFSL